MRHPSDWIHDLMEKTRKGKGKRHKFVGMWGFFSQVQRWECLMYQTSSAS
jgi:hypothetical protein